MDLRDIKYFYSIAQAGNITEAANRLNISQPPLSQQMKRLEEELGVKLFERGARKIRLTDAGQLLRDRAEFILEFIDKTEVELKEFGNGLTGSLSLGTISTSGAKMLPILITLFHEKYPRVTFQMWEGNGDRIVSLLKTRIIELGIIRQPFDSKFFAYFLLSDEPLVFVINEDKYPELAKQSELPLKAIEKKPLMVPRRWAENFKEECNKKGFAPNIISQSDSSIQDILWAQSGVAIAVLPASAANIIKSNDLVFRKIVEPEMPTQAALVWERERKLSIVAKNFISVVQENNA